MIGRIFQIPFQRIEFIFADLKKIDPPVHALRFSSHSKIEVFVEERRAMQERQLDFMRAADELRRVTAERQQEQLRLAHEQREQLRREQEIVMQTQLFQAGYLRGLREMSPYQPSSRGPGVPGPRYY